jgi:hypothetical protein
MVLASDFQRRTEKMSWQKADDCMPAETSALTLAAASYFDAATDGAQQANYVFCVYSLGSNG